MSALPDFALINMHTHLRSHWNNARNLGDHLEGCGLSALNVACISDMRGDRLATNALALWLKLQHPGRLYAFAGLHYAVPGLADPPSFDEQARQIVSLGFDGVKLIEGKPTARKEVGIALDDPRYAPVYAACERAGLPILMHIADPEELWDVDALPEWARRHNWFYGDGTFPTKEQLYSEVDHILESFPRLKVVLAHFSFLSADRERADRFLTRFPNACFDLTPGGEMYLNFSLDPEAWRAFFQRYRGRIMLGTDNGGGTDYPDEAGLTSARERIAEIRRFLETTEPFQGFQEGATVRGLGLDEETLRAIYADNFYRIAGRPARPVNVAELRIHIQQLSDRLSADKANRAEALRLLEELDLALAEPAPCCCGG